MKFFILTLFVCMVVLAFVVAVPVDETIAGDLYGSEHLSAQDPNSIFKIKKIKKLLFG